MNDIGSTVAPCQAPAGFTELSGPAGPYFHALGPVWGRPDEAAQTLTLGLRVKTLHTNILGIPHGGMLLTFADAAMGINLGRRWKRAPGQALVTASLTSDFLGAARVGDWLEARVTLRKTGRQLGFAECLLVAVNADGDKPILRASGVFSLTPKPGAEAPPDG